ncbi:MAG: helix-turn-helix domain-containing protein [Acidimicrobiales bacterium]
MADERRHAPLLPGFKEMAERRHALAGDLAARRVALGLTQTEVAARMGTSQSAVARVESGASDVRFSTLERYAAALGQVVDWALRSPPVPFPTGADVTSNDGPR